MLRMDDSDNPIAVRQRLKEIKRQIVGCNALIDELSCLIGHLPEEEPPSSIFLYGDSSTGKSLVLSKCLSIANFASAVVNCTESYSVQLIYENIINQLAKYELNQEDNYQPYKKCSNMSDFILALRSVADEFAFGHESGRSIILVFDKCEKLRNLDKTVLPAFLKLRELTNLKLCAIFVSALPWERFFPYHYVTQPITIFFGQYEQKQLQQILMLKKPDNVSTEFYEGFISLFLSVFFSACHDVRELQYQAALTFDHYYEPIKKGELQESDSGQLWKRSQTFFKKALRSLYLKIDCSMELSEVENITSATTQALIMELPYYSKYILIGAYIASYNPASEDRRLFVKRRSRRKKIKAKSDRTKHHLLGPKPFNLQRLFAIVAAILNDDQFNLNADLYVEVGSLVRMKLMTQVSEDILDGPSFKCNVGLQFIDVISRNVQFNIRKYLVDFIES